MENENMLNLQAHVQHNGQPPFALVVDIKHEELDGGHFFTSDKIPGLLVGHRDITVAIKQLPWVIEELMKRNKDMECSVKLGMAPEAHQPSFAIIENKQVA